jgi:hypothetical protein
MEEELLKQILAAIKEMHEDTHRELREIKIRLMEINK